jgi:hypothetical protein
MPPKARPTQKEIERWQLQRFIDLFQPTRWGEVLDHEEPDFLVRRELDTLGIEFTDLYWDQPSVKIPQQAVESLRARIADEAGRLYESKGLPKLHVSIHFIPSYVPTKKDVPRLSTAIANLIVDNIPSEGSSYSEDYDWNNRAYFPEGVHHIGAWQQPGLKRSYFNSPGAAMIPNLGRKDIERALASKQSKLERYRSNCQEVWLVINCDGAQLSTTFEYDEATTNTSFASGFDRAFLLRHMASKVHELPLTAHGSHPSVGFSLS